eukprot:jgi/Chrzof1/12264/Cz06g27200.t1
MSSVLSVGDNSIESLFAEEIKRRGMNGSLDFDEAGSKQTERKAASPSAASTSTSQSPFQSATKTSQKPPTGKKDVDPASGQRERSIAMVSEGLEGLIPRASELLKLGGSVFLAFAPFILVISLLFSGIYMVMGDSFVHGGSNTSGPPAYIDPETLLSEPTIDPYIPYQ